MWFDDARQIEKIVAGNGTSVLVMPEDVPVELPRAVVLESEGRATITIEQVRNMTSGLGLKQTEDRFVIIRPAEKLGPEAANALLKNLEEPGEKVHYVLVTEAPSRLLPTILSRAAVYFWRGGEGFSLEIRADEKQKLQAKQLIAAKPAEIIEIAEKIAKKKTARAEALEILGLAVEMLYKSYFITGKDVFVKKIPKFLRAYENIAQNGHVKLQIIANLV